MKKQHVILFVIIISFILPASSLAQSASYTTNSGLIIGFGTGSSFQVSDIKNSSGYGFDFRLGSYLYKKENAPLAVDWKFRFLAGSNTAFDHRQNTDNTYSNIMLNHFNYDLELGLNLNRLRERTRIVVTGYLGFGITHGITYADLEDAGGSAYDYLVIDPGAERSEIVSDLRNLSDGDFESKVDSKAAILPTAGIFLGYQLSSSFALGLDYKINFSLGENPGAFAINMDGIPLESSAIDMNHYVSLGFKWTIRNRSESAKRYRANTSPAYVTPPPVERIIPETGNKAPEIDITIPYRRIHTSTDRDVNITARTRRISNKEDIRVLFNDEETDFKFSADEGKIELAVHLVRDTNMLEMFCKNAISSACDDRILIYREKASAGISRPANTLRVTTNTGDVNTNVVRSDTRREEIVVSENTGQQNITANTSLEKVEVSGTELPLVKIINPPHPLTVDRNIFNLRAQTGNIERWEDVEVIVNGKKLTNFNLTRDGLISMNIALQEGKNNIEVSGQNTAGSAVDRTKLTFERIVNFPVIEEVKPVVDPVVTVVDPVVTVVDTAGTGADPVTVIAQPADTVRDVIDIVEVVTPPASTEPEAIRINPGNSDWEFCLVTPSGRYNRSALASGDFKYNGRASSIFFKPIGGGGNAIVKGKKYSLRSGQYYLFTGGITVTVSNSNPGSMGHWSVMIVSESAPVSGTGNNRPASPCESVTNSGKKPKK